MQVIGERKQYDGGEQTVVQFERGWGERRLLPASSDTGPETW